MIERFFMISIVAKIYYEKGLWRGLFERTDIDGYTAAKKIFGAEPSDAEVYDFVLHHYDELNFGEQKEFILTVKRENPKRVRRELRKEMERLKETSRPSTFAQDYMREQQELHKKSRKKASTHEKRAQAEEKFAKKQQKKKKKQKGH